METQLIIFIIISCIAIISPATAIIGLFSFYKRKMSEKEAMIKRVEQEKQIESYKMVIDAEDKEREKIAKNLHDGILPKLSVIKSSLDMNAEDYNTGKYNLNRLKKDIYNLEETIVEIREVSHDLVPASLLLNGVIRALEHHIDYAPETGKSKVHFENRTSFEDDIPMGMPDQHNVFRICLEILHNLFKHSNYTILNVIVETQHEKLKIEFIHDGKGISNSEIERLTEASAGLGLKSLRSRTLILNASLDYSFDNETAGIILCVPMKNNIIGKK